MNVYKRDKSGPYWFRFRFNNKQIRRSSGVYDKQDAIDIACGFRTRLAKGEVGIEKPEEKAPIPRFSEAMAAFLEWSETEHAARPSTHRRYITSSKALLSYFGNMPIEKIDKDEVEKFKTWRSKQRKTLAGKAVKGAQRIRPATTNRELALLKHLFNHYDKVMPHNPVRKVKMLDEDNQQERVLNREEEALYLLASTQPLTDIATLMLETGMRPEEACRIRRENVHLDEGYLFIPFGKTKAARRRLYLSEQQARSIEILARRLETVAGDFLFPGRVEGRPIVKVNNAHTAAVKRSKVARFKLYDLRHTFATRKAQDGVDIVTLAAILGHSKLAMVMRYVHPTAEHQRAAMQKIQRTAAR